MARYEIDQNLCIQCGACAQPSVCPYSAIYQEAGLFYIDQGLCGKTGICVDICPYFAISNVEAGIAPAPLELTVPATTPPTTVVLSWVVAGETPTYVIEEALDLYFTNISRTAYTGAGGTGTSRSATITGLVPGSTYFYRIKAVQAGLVDSEWVYAIYGCLCTNDAQAVSAVDAPLNSPTGTYTITWTTSITPNAVYTLEESLDADFTAPLVLYTGSGTLHNITGKAVGTYYYRVITTASGYTNPGIRYAINTTIVTNGVPPLSGNYGFQAWNASGDVLCDGEVRLVRLREILGVSIPQDQTTKTAYFTKTYTTPPTIHAQTARMDNIYGVAAFASCRVTPVMSQGAMIGVTVEILREPDLVSAVTVTVYVYASR